MYLSFVVEICVSLYSTDFLKSTPWKNNKSLIGIVVVSHSMGLICFQIHGIKLGARLGDVASAARHTAPWSHTPRVGFDLCSPDAAKTTPPGREPTAARDRRRNSDVTGKLMQPLAPARGRGFSRILTASPPSKHTLTPQKQTVLCT